MICWNAGVADGVEVCGRAGQPLTDGVVGGVEAGHGDALTGY